MPQRVRLDWPVGLAYVLGGALGCHPPAAPPLSTGLSAATPEQVAQWVARTTPQRAVLHRFTWLYQDEQASKGGRGSVRITLGDSLRIDFAGSLGIGKGSAMVVGDSALWVVPKRSLDDLVPGAALLWAVLGVAQAPRPGDRLAGLESEDRTAWRYIRDGDTVSYLRVSASPPVLYAEVRRDGQILGRTELRSREDGTPLKAKLTVPRVPSKLEISFYATVPTDSFPQATWAPPAEP